ncbi:UNVERIFIED_CONTAM: hypothetical protein NCL1_20969 [Trichonephila clavipes]
MASMQRDHWSHVWLQCLLLSLLLCRNVVLPDSNKYYRTTSLCLHQNDQAMYKKVDGAVITSENELNLKCVLTFQTDTVLQRFMLRFEHLALDCKDHLYIFDGDQKFGKYELACGEKFIPTAGIAVIAFVPFSGREHVKLQRSIPVKHDLSCRSTRSDVGTIFTQGNYVTLKYETDNRTHAGNGFKLIITAVKKPNTGCQTFRCLNDLCIAKNLTCDGVNHCGDNSDETSQANCADETATKQILGLNFGTFVSLVLGIFLICCVCVVGVIICVFRKEAQQRQLETEAHLGTPHSMVVGQSPYPRFEYEQWPCDLAWPIIKPFSIPACLHSRAYLQHAPLSAGGEAAPLSGKYVPPPNAGRRPQRRRLLSCKVKSATGRRPKPPKKEWLV